MILPLLVGVVLGAACVVLMYRAGLLAERSGVVVLVCAVAAFYPVFALASDASLFVVLFHILVFGCFAGAAVWGFHAGTSVLAFLLVSHGLFDAGAALLTSPAPEWWPPFCAGVDIAIGAGLFSLLRRQDIPA